MSRARINAEMQRKIKKMLAVPLMVRGEAVSVEDRSRLVKGMRDGSTITSKNAALFEISEGGAKKPFLEKQGSADPVSLAFGAALTRVLSAKTYAAKRTLVSNDLKTGFDQVTAVKWDENLRPIKGLEDGGIYKKAPEDQLLKEGLDRYAGVLAVLGSTDFNPDNYLRSQKTGKLVAIDMTPLGNHDAGYGHEFVAYGSAHTRDTLNGFAGNNAALSRVDADKALSKVNRDFDTKYYNLELKLQRAKLQLSLAKTRKLPPHLLKTYQDKITELQNLRRGLSEDHVVTWHNVFNDVYAKGVDDKLFSQIVARAEKYPSIKEGVKNFGRGLRDAIDLSQNDQFLDAYKRKAAQELGEDAAEKVGFMIKAFKANATKAQQQYSALIEYCKELELKEQKLEVENTQELVLDVSQILQESLRSQSPAFSDSGIASDEELDNISFSGSDLDGESDVDSEFDSKEVKKSKKQYSYLSSIARSEDLEAEYVEIVQDIAGWRKQLAEKFQDLSKWEAQIELAKKRLPKKSSALKGVESGQEKLIRLEMEDLLKLEKQLNIHGQEISELEEDFLQNYSEAAKKFEQEKKSNIPQAVNQEAKPPSLPKAANGASVSSNGKKSPNFDQVLKKSEQYLQEKRPDAVLKNLASAVSKLTNASSGKNAAEALWPSSPKATAKQFSPAERQALTAFAQQLSVASGDKATASKLDGKMKNPNQILDPSLKVAVCQKIIGAAKDGELKNWLDAKMSTKTPEGDIASPKAFKLQGRGRGAELTSRV